MLMVSLFRCILADLDQLHCASTSAPTSAPLASTAGPSALQGRLFNKLSLWYVFMPEDQECILTYCDASVGWQFDHCSFD